MNFKNSNRWCAYLFIFNVQYEAQISALNAQLQSLQVESKTLHTKLDKLNASQRKELTNQESVFGRTQSRMTTTSTMANDEMSDNSADTNTMQVEGAIQETSYTIRKEQHYSKKEVLSFFFFNAQELHVSTTTRSDAAKEKEEEL